jgi:hypothetical protein
MKCDENKKETNSSINKKKIDKQEKELLKLLNEHNKKFNM